MAGELKRILRRRGFRVLLATRLSGQFSDGLVQSSLATFVLFSPEHQASPAAVASAFAILLLPYSLIGPFAGVLLDRWRRRSVLVRANLLRAVSLLPVMWLVNGSHADAWLGLTVLITVGIGRFVLAGLAASLPHVVEPDELMLANSFKPTAGTIAYAIGAVAGVALRGYAGGGDQGSLVVLVLALLMYVLAGLLPRALAVDSLGPLHEAPTATAGEVLSSFAGGVRELHRQPAAAKSLAMVFVARVLVGSLTITLLLVLRNVVHTPDEADAALRDFSLVAVGVTVGAFLAAVLTPRFGRLAGPVGWTCAAFVLAGVVITPALFALAVLPVLLAAPPSAVQPVGQDLLRLDHPAADSRRCVGPRVLHRRPGRQRGAGARGLPGRLPLPRQRREHRGVPAGRCSRTCWRRACTGGRVTPRWSPTPCSGCADGGGRSRAGFVPRHAQGARRVAGGSPPDWSRAAACGQLPVLDRPPRRIGRMIRRGRATYRLEEAPTYHLSVVADDIDMAITHVVRGDDHISNTPKQVLLYQAFGASTPYFAHVPLIMGPDKKRLSKRHGATSVMEYPRLGYLPEAMVNFLALLGWSPGNDQELFTKDELVQAFTLEGISGGNAVFNPEKLDWFNQQHIMRLPTDALAVRLEPLLRDAGLWQDAFAGPARPWLLQVLDLFKPRAKRLGQFVDDGRIFFAETIDYDAAAVARHLRAPGMAEHLAAWRDVLGWVEPFDPASLEKALRDLADARAVKPAALIHATRVGVTGRTVSPGLFEVLTLLGRERVESRLGQALELATT